MAQRNKEKELIGVRRAPRTSPELVPYALLEVSLPVSVKYLYQNICMCVNIYIYIYIYMHRDREREREM